MVKLKPDSTVDRMVEGLTVYKVKCVELPITAQGEMICILVHTDISCFRYITYTYISPIEKVDQRHI